MAVSDIRKSVLDIINEVQRKLGVNATTTLTQTKHATVLLRLLNETVAEVSDLGDWLELYKEATVTAQSSVSRYAVDVQYVVHHVEEIRWSTDPSPLEVRNKEDIRRLLAVGGFGTPRQFALTGLNSQAQPLFDVYPVPTTAKTFGIYYYEKPPIYETTDTTEEPPFPANLLIQGTYAKALLDENGGEPTRQYQVAYTEYRSMATEALNRYTSDTGTDVYFTPQRYYR